MCVCVHVFKAFDEQISHFLFRVIATNNFLKKNHSCAISFILNKLIPRNILPENYKSHSGGNGFVKF